MNPVQRYARVKKTVVEINVIGSDVDVRDGIIIALREHDTIILMNGHGITSSSTVLFPYQKMVSEAKILASGEGIAILSCPNLTPDQQHNLEEVELFEGNLQDFQEVHTYSDHQKYRVLTPGNIMSLYDGGFNHSCSAHTITKYGSPVFNNDAQLVGMCFDFAEHLSAHNITGIARRIDTIFGREYTSVQLTFQNLRQQNGFWE